MPSSEYVMAFDLGGTKCAAALISRDGTMEDHLTIKYRQGKAIETIIIRIIEALVQKTNMHQYKISGIGISVPGISYKNKGTVWAPNIEGWEDYPLYQLVKDHLPDKDIPVFIESDRGCSILGEQWMGSARGSINSIFLAVGTGIGAGILIDGHIIRGMHDIAGAVGWMALERPYHKKLASFGCFEYYASGDGLVRAAREYIRTESTDLINKQTIAKLKAEDLFNAYYEGDPLAIKVIKQAIEFWGMATANLVSIFNPEIIIFGGGVFGPGIRFLDQIYEEASKWAQPIAIKNVRFIESGLKGNAPLFGAAYLVFRQSLKSNPS